MADKYEKGFKFTLSNVVACRRFWRRHSWLVSSLSHPPPFSLSPSYSRTHSAAGWPSSGNCMASKIAWLTVISFLFSLLSPLPPLFMWPQSLTSLMLMMITMMMTYWHTDWEKEGTGWERESEDREEEDNKVKKKGKLNLFEGNK